MAMEHITETGERWRRRGGVVEVGLSPAVQKEIGEARLVRLPALGNFIRAGEHLGVVEGTLTAAEFYTPCDGRVVWVARSDARISNWLVRIAPAYEGSPENKAMASRKP